MSKPSDLVKPGLQFSFYERTPVVEMEYAFTAGKKDSPQVRLNMGRSSWAKTPITDRFLYVFSADGIEYGMKSGDPGWMTRISPLYGFQHSDQFEPSGSVPPRSKAGDPTRVHKEIYFDRRGLMWELDLSKDDVWKRPRIKRPHPKWKDHLPNKAEDEDALEAKLLANGRSGKTAVSLPFPADGSPRRFFFILSPLRFGPEAFKAAMDGSIAGADGLTWLWLKPPVLSGGVKGPLSTEFRALIQPAIGVVDPWNAANRLSNDLFEPALDEYLRAAQEMPRDLFRFADGQYFDNEKNEGSIKDLLFMAGVLNQLSGRASHDPGKKDKDLLSALNHKRIDEVLSIYSVGVQTRQNAVEIMARFAANWLRSPAHRIVDTVAIKDCEDPADNRAAHDKAAALYHWHNCVRLLPNSFAGAAVLRETMSKEKDSPNVPIRDLFAKYEKDDHPIDEQSTDQLAFSFAGDILPDLFLIYGYRQDPAVFEGKIPVTPADMQAAAARMGNLLTNLKYLDTPVVDAKKLKKSPVYDAGKDLKKPWAWIKNFGKSMVYVADYGYRKGPAPGEGWIRKLYLDRQYAKELESGLLNSNGVAFKGRMTSTQFRRIADELAAARKILETQQAEMLKALKGHKAALDEMTAALGNVKTQLGKPKVSREIAEQASKDYAVWKALKESYEAERAEVNASMQQAQISDMPAARPSNFPAAAQSYDAALARFESAKNRLMHVDQSLREADQELAGIRRVIEEADATSDAAVKANLARKVDLEQALKELQSRRKEAFKSLGDVENALKKSAKRWSRLADAEAKAVKTGKQIEDLQKAKLTDGKVSVSFICFAMEAFFAGMVMRDDNATGVKKGWAAADLGKALVDLGKDVMKQQGISEFAFCGKEKGGWGLVKPPAGGATLRLNVLGISVTALAVIGGLYNVGKYGITGIDAYRMGDYSVIFGAGLGVVGGVVTVYAALVAADLAPVFISAGAAGAVAGILVAAGAIIVTVTADSDWEKFAKKCFFSSDESTRNIRPVDPEVFGEGETHWIGKVDHPEGRELDIGILKDTCRWGVQNQRRAMERLLSRFVVYTMATIEEDGDFDVRLSYTVHVEFEYLPPGASLNLDVRHSRMQESITIDSMALTSSQLNSGATRTAKEMKGLYAPEGGPGWVLWQRHQEKRSAARKFWIDCVLTLADGSRVKCCHQIAEQHEWTDENGMTEPLIYYTTNWYPTYASNFENVSDIKFKG